MDRIFLSPPHMSPHEREFLLDAFDSNWIAPLGPHVDAFEKEFASMVGVGSAAALSSCTAALHLSLLLLNVKPGDEVITSTLSLPPVQIAITYTEPRRFLSTATGKVGIWLPICWPMSWPPAPIVENYQGRNDCRSLRPMRRLCSDL